MAAAKDGPTPWWAKDATPGYLLVAAALLSFLLQNGPFQAAWQSLLKEPVSLIVGGYHLDSYVKGMVKDALMAVFFLFVGLELKRECIVGPFKNPREAALPMLGAIGGMAAPALIFLLVATILHPDASEAYARGWAIPAATDIAFAVGVLSLLGSRVPSGLRLFLLALAIVDDLGAIVVIALFYTESVNVAALAVSGALLAGLFTLNQRGVRALTPYWVLGVLLWFAMAKTGVSPTLAGVLTALAIPMYRPDGRSPLVAAEHALKPYVQLGIMPVFALVMAGVALEGVTLASFTHPVALGVAAGLVLGKPIGILTLTMIGAAVLKQKLPGRPVELLGVAIVAGIGFTMSLFVGALAYGGDPALEAPIRFGVLGGSILSAVLGLLILNAVLKSKAPAAATAELAAEEDLAEQQGVLEKQ
jgi:Na+:H+ antiporter, NhaA family